MARWQDTHMARWRDTHGTHGATHMAGRWQRHTWHNDGSSPRLLLCVTETEPTPMMSQRCRPCTWLAISHGVLVDARKTTRLVQGRVRDHERQGVRVNTLTQRGVVVVVCEVGDATVQSGTCPVQESRDHSLSHAITLERVTPLPPSTCSPQACCSDFPTPPPLLAVGALLPAGSCLEHHGPQDAHACLGLGLSITVGKWHVQFTELPCRAGSTKPSACPQTRIMAAGITLVGSVAGCLRTGTHIPERFHDASPYR